jgi:hypothetical protein
MKPVITAAMIAPEAAITAAQIVILFRLDTNPPRADVLPGLHLADP